MKLSVVASLALSATCVVAAPSPKYLEMKGIKRPARKSPVPVANLAVNAVVNSNASVDASPVTANKTNIWASLSNDEAASVVSFLHAQDFLNLTAAEDAGAWDNAIKTLDLVSPNKTAALAYMDGSGPAPPRVAKAFISFAATEEPYLEEYIIHLPITNDTIAVPADFYTTKGSAKIRNYDADGDDTYEFALSNAEEVKDIIEDLLGAPFDSFSYWGIDPLWHLDGRVISWLGTWGEPATVFDGQTLLPQGLYMQLDITGRSADGWSFNGWLYNDIFYNSHAAFRAAWNSTSFEKATRNSGSDDLTNPWFGSDKVGDALPLDTIPPPMQIQPAEARFKVDVEQKFVEWMDFSFYVTFTHDTGIRLFDIKYKGTRILFELGLNEAIAHYSGNDPAQSGTAYLDSWYGFGPYSFELVPAFDCPAYATFLDLTFHANEVSTTHRNGLCLFESDQGYPMQRHSSGAYVSATKNVAFVVRAVSTVGNYDYSFDYTFYLDGSIETTVRASGYIQSAFYAKNEDYGYHIHDGLSGSMHDHVLSWKADFDILGVNNTLSKHAIVPTREKYVWSNTTRSTMKLQRSNVTSEDEGKINWPANAQIMYIVSNFDEKNKFGEPRGYRIMPSRGGGMHLTIQESDNLFNSQSFATHQLYVTKQHDYEQAISHAGNAYDPREPIIDFADYFNGESLVQEDLVLWFNLGMHHVPHTGDIPNTVQTTAQASMMISPHNYLLSDPSRQTSQQIRLNYNSSANDIVESVKTFGSTQVSGTVNLTAIDYSTYSGDSNVRKFPLYLPNDAYNYTESIV